jgi:hypothetical protein
MKKLTILKITAALAIIFLGYANSWGQHTVPVPAASGTTLYEKGYNVASPSAVVGTETPDLVTTGTKVPYLVIPDATLNPTWSAGTDATNTTGINSTWTWTIPGTVSSTAPTTGHFITIDITGATGATGNITVAEQSGAACPGSSQTIGLQVVAQPAATALAVSDATAPVTSICQSGTNGSLGVAIPTFTVTKSTDAAIPGNPTLRVKATLTFTPFGGSAAPLFTNAILNVDNTGNISVADIQAAASITTFDSWGTYDLTVNQISDKISRKDLNAAGGYFNINGVTGYTASYSVLKTPTTGPIYHLPNN